MNYFLCTLCGEHVYYHSKNGLCLSCSRKQPSPKNRRSRIRLDTSIKREDFDTTYFVCKDCFPVVKRRFPRGFLSFVCVDPPIRPRGKDPFSFLYERLIVDCSYCGKGLDLRIHNSEEHEEDIELEGAFAIAL